MNSFPAEVVIGTNGFEAKRAMSEIRRFVSPFLEGIIPHGFHSRGISPTIVHESFSGISGWDFVRMNMATSSFSRLLAMTMV